MILTTQQKFYLDTVRAFRCLRLDQLHTLLQRKFHTPDKADINENHMATMLRQLRYCNWDIRVESGYVYIPDAQPDQRLLESIDVMIELSQHGSVDFKLGSPSPTLLRFTLSGEKLQLFTIASLSLTEDVDSLERKKMERIIWVSDNGQMPEGLIFPPKHFFAVRQEDGSHRFYGSTEP